MHTRELIRINQRATALLIGSRPGSEYAGVNDRQALLDREAKLCAVRAFVDRHDPDIIFTIAGMTCEAESMGAEYETGDYGQPILRRSPLSQSISASELHCAPLKSSPLCTSVIDSLRDLAASYPRKIVGTTLTGPLSIAGQLLGMERMLLLSVEHPAALRAILRVLTGRVMEFMGAQIGAGARYVSINEPAGSLLSPGGFREICLPFLKEIFAAITLPNHLHICGHVQNHLRVLRETGAHAISIDSCVDLQTAGRIFAPDIVTLGHIDCTGALLRGTPAEVAEETRTMLARMAEIKNYIPATSCGLPRATPAANIQAFLDVVRSIS
jgi:MtaA/CmuA family methyltransferase